MDEKIERLIKWLKGGKAPPYMLELRITNECNLKCLSCFQRNFDGKKRNYDNELSLDLWLTYVHEAAAMGVKLCRITGSGEPVCRPKIVISLASLIKTYGMKGFMLTNGTIFSKKIVKKLVQIGWDEIAFSLDGPDPDVNDYLRGKKGAFKKTVKAIKLFNFYKNRLRTFAPKISIVPVVSNQNYDKLSKIIELAHKLKVKDVYFQIMMIHSPIGEKIKIKQEQLGELPKHVFEAQKTAKLYGVNTNLDRFLNQGWIETPEKILNSNVRTVDENISFNSLQCFLPFYYMGIREDGRIEPCVTDENIKNTHKYGLKNLEKIWYGKRFNLVRKQLLAKKLLSRCSNCCPSQIIDNMELQKQLKRYL